MSAWYGRYMRDLHVGYTFGRYTFELGASHGSSWGRVALARPSGSVLMGGGRGRGAHLGVSYVTHCFDTRGCLGRQDERRDHRRGVFTPIYPPWQVAYHQRVGISPIGSVIQHERSCGCAVNRHLGKTRTARSIDNPRTEPTGHRPPRTWRPGYSCVKTTGTQDKVLRNID